MSNNKEQAQEQEHQQPSEEQEQEPITLGSCYQGHPELIGDYPSPENLAYLRKVFDQQALEDWGPE